MERSGAISGMISNAPLATPGLSATVVPVLAVPVRTHGVGAAMTPGALSGFIVTLIGALRVGRLFSYLPHPVIAAFTSGLGVIIVSKQIKAVFGVEPTPAGFDLGAPVGTVQGAVATWRPCEAHTQEAIRSLPLPVPYPPAATRLEPIVPDPATKEPSAIDPLFKPRSNKDREGSRGSRIEDRGSQIEDKGSHRITMFDPRPSIIDPQSSSLPSFLRGLYQSPPSRFSGRERMRSQWRQSTSNRLQAPEEKNHDRPATLQTT
jgi:sulfate permease family protein